MGLVQLSSKHLKTLTRIFERPTRSDIEWREVESLLNAFGAKITEGNGSRKRISLNNVRAVFHEPHPRKELDKGAIKSLKSYLVISGMVDDQGNVI
jgi:hypothetical protein